MPPQAPSWLPLEPPYPAVQWVLVCFEEVKRPKRDNDYPPNLEPRLKKTQTYTSTPFWVFMDCSIVNFTLGRHILVLCTFFFQLPHVLSFLNNKRICVKTEATSALPESWPMNYRSHFNTNYSSVVSDMLNDLLLNTNKHCSWWLKEMCIIINTSPHFF